MTSLQIAGVDLSSPVNVWINEASISYDGEVSRLGTLLRQQCAPARVFVEKKMSMHYADYNEDGLTRKATLERVRGLALLLRKPRHFGFATMPCLGVITDLNDKSLRRAGEVKLVYELPATADPLAHPVSLHNLLFLEEYRSEEPPEIDVRFQLVTSLANALHEMHCTEWLHRNISSKVIFFLKTKPGSGIESFDLEKPYMAGFDAARSFKAYRCLISDGIMMPKLINIRDICSTTIGPNLTQRGAIPAISFSTCPGMTTIPWAWYFLKSACGVVSARFCFAMCPSSMIAASLQTRVYARRKDRISDLGNALHTTEHGDRFRSSHRRGT